MAGRERKLAERVAAQIEADIAAMGWPVGQVIGSESVLIAKYGVSRAVFREAVRLVEHHLIARMRPGPSGGLVVTEQDPETVARAMSLYLSFAQVQPGELLEIRSHIESLASERAAQRATDEERVELRKFLDGELDMVRESWLGGKEFHLRVAALANNPAIYLFVRCLVDLTENQTRPEEEREGTAQRVHEVHRAIAEAIIAGDGAMARYRMSKHINAISPWLAEPGGGQHAPAERRPRPMAPVSGQD